MERQYDYDKCFGCPRCSMHHDTGYYCNLWCSPIEELTPEHCDSIKELVTE